MSEPVIERIALEIQKRLAPATILRPGRVLTEELALSSPVVIQQQSIRPLPNLDYPGNPPAKAYEATFNINCFLESKATEDEFAKLCNQKSADVIRLITNPDTDPTYWHSFGGLAINASFGQMRDLPTEIAVNGGVTVPLLIQFRVSENDHTQVR